MSLETATFIDDLDANNPVGTDTKSQGDDHLRLVKSVLKNSIKRVTRAFYVPGTVHKTANYIVVAADDNKTITCDTTSAFTLTLPTLGASDAGWCIYVLKTSADANPVWIAPPSGTINGFSKVRRAVSYSLVKVLWNGGAFYASRSFGVPIGSVIDCHGTSLASGCLWPDGTTFTAADYVELNSVLGGNTKPDYRGRSASGLDNLGGSSANRLQNGVFSATRHTLGAAGGADTHTLASSEIPSHLHTQTGQQPTLTFNSNEVQDTGGGASTVTTILASGGTTTVELVADATPGNTGSTGGGGSHNNMGPTILSNKMLVTE